MTSDEVRSYASHAARLDRYASVSAALAALDDRRLGELVTAAPSLGAGLGGTGALMHVAGTQVFVKRVPLTDLERRPEHVGSTANLFALPMGCQYGAGGAPSFGAWREVAANQMATNWVLGGRAECFPLTYHWRVLDRPASPAPLPEELADVERAVALLHGSAAVRRRIEAIAHSTATVALFLEHVPQGLPEWLAREVARGGDAADAAIARVERSLRADVAFMNSAGLFHFDAHFGNIRADDERLYFADFGLATSPHFRLSPTEIAFLEANRSHDACHTITRLVDWLVTELTGSPDSRARNETIRRIAAGDVPEGLPPSAAAVVARYAPIAVVINEFYRMLHLVDRTTTYPVAEALRACAACGVTIPGTRT